LLTPPPENKVREFTWQRKIFDRETIEISKLPFMWNYRYLSALLIARLTLILLEAISKPLFRRFAAFVKR